MSTRGKHAEGNKNSSTLSSTSRLPVGVPLRSHSAIMISATRLLGDKQSSHGTKRRKVPQDGDIVNAHSAYWLRRVPRIRSSSVLTSTDFAGWIWANAGGNRCNKFIRYYRITPTTPSGYAASMYLDWALIYNVPNLHRQCRPPCIP